MSELKGAVFSLAIFVAFLIPFFLTMGIGSIHQHAFMKVTTEVSEIVKEEGGVTEKVNNIVSNLEEKGYEISFKDRNGATVNGKQTFGDEVIIDYRYEYQDVRGKRTLNTQNAVFVMRR